jgi:hypothetical protein
MTEKSHLTPQCPGIGEADEPARARIVSRAMMGGRAFILLKVGLSGPETAKQTEIRLAVLPKILGNRPLGGPKLLARGGQDVPRLYFRVIPFDMANLTGIIVFVIQITVLARKPAQYPARRRREKITSV